MSQSFFHLLLLIIIANGTPIIVRNVFGNLADYPVDFGQRFFDHKPVFGKAKTWRGFISSLVVTSLVAYLLGYEVSTGAQIACFAMLGDLLSSFIKRRLGMPPSSMAPVLDQVPESLLPVLFLKQAFELSSVDVSLLILAFIILELVLSQLLYRVGIRRRPY